MATFYWIGPESSIYHSRSDCRHLKSGPTSYRYWPVDSGPKPPTSSGRNRGSDRTLCLTCKAKDTKETSPNG